MQIKSQIVKLSRNQLKIIAIITMIIDHIGVAFFTEGHIVYEVLRFIGRISFPVFLFIFLDGFFMSQNRKKHIFELLFFGIVSEPFYDKALHGQWFDWSSQNVMLTWFLCYTMLCFLEMTKKCKILYRIAYSVGIITVYILISYFLKVDYGFIGILCMTTCYYLSISKIVMPILLGASYLEPGTLLSIPILCLYDKNKPCKKPNKVLKYIMYWFYPVHLLIIAVIQMLFNI